MSQSILRKDCFAVMVKVSMRAHMIKIWSFLHNLHRCRSATSLIWWHSIIMSWSVSWKDWSAVFKVTVMVQNFLDWMFVSPVFSVPQISLQPKQACGCISNQTYCKQSWHYTAYWQQRWLAISRHSAGGILRCMATSLVSTDLFCWWTVGGRGLSCWSLRIWTRCLSFCSLFWLVLIDSVQYCVLIIKALFVCAVLTAVLDSESRTITTTVFFTHFFLYSLVAVLIWNSINIIYL